MKRSLERLLVRSGASSAFRRFLLRDVVLCYHNVVPHGATPCGELSLHLPQREFARQLDVLLATHTVVELDELVEASDRGERPRAAITFDDAYRGAISAGFAELASRDLPATMFVAPGILGDEMGWWDAAADECGVVTEDFRQQALSRFGGRNSAVLSWMRDDGLGCEQMPKHARTAHEDELLHACTSTGVSFGSHGWSHADLTRLGRAEIEQELEASAEWLAARTGGKCRWLAYPYGHASSEVRDVARRHFSASFCCAGGLYGGASRESPHALPRVNVPSGISIYGFELLVSGL